MYLGLDLGTSSLKAILVDRQSAVRWVGEERYDVQLSGDRAEMAVSAWWYACQQLMSTAPTELRREVSAVGFSGQMHGLVLVDDGGRAIRNAILWPDRRATEHLGPFQAFEDTHPGVLGNPIVPGMPGPMLAWLQTNEPETVANAAQFIAPKDWLRSQLTGETPIVTDPSDASATLLYDTAADGWSEHLVASLGLPPTIFADLADSGSAAGVVTGPAAEALGVPAGVPVAVGAGDAAAALLGLGIEGLGRVLLNVGTGAQVMAVVDRPNPSFAQLGFHQFRSASPDRRWYVMAPIINAGLALDWVTGVLALEWEELYRHAADALTHAETDPTFVPFLAGERDPEVGLDARAAWVDLTPDHDRDAMARAALLGVAGYLARRTRVVLDAVGADRVELSGGSIRNQGWTDLLATLIGVDIELAPDTHASARGAAVTAARSVGQTLPPPTAGRA